MVKQERILSLDTATKTGYAIYKKGKITAHGTWVFPSKNASGHADKLTKFHKQLKRTIREERITTIVAEDIFLENSRLAAFVALGEMRGIIYLVCSQCGVQLADFISPKRHKELLTGCMYANKAETIVAVKKLGYQVQDDNDADAISIMLAHLQLNKLPIIHPVQE